MDPNHLFSGLSDAEVLSSRQEHGSNVLKDGGRKPLSILTGVLKEPMLILLMIACSIYFFMGEISEGLIMLLSIAAVAGISIYQEIRSENALKALRKLSQPLTLVIRNGKKISIPSGELVTGDVMIISEGQQVPADAGILDSNDLSVDESILTGESFPVEKDHDHPEIFSGTTIVTGLAHARITAVGNGTRIGKLGKEMEEIKKGKTPLQLQIQRFVKRMALFGVAAFIIVWIFNFFDTRDIISSLMHGLTLAMAVLPEEIPVALSTFMALGAFHLIRNHVLARHPQTVEALGSATVICVDKTGTITENKMEVAEIYVHSAGKNSASNELEDNVAGRELTDYAMWASEPVPFDPMEKALHEFFQKHGSREIHPLKMIKEYPLSGRPPMMTHIYDDEKGGCIVSCKGAPEGIVRVSNLGAAEQTRILELVHDMAAKGLRVLGVAKAEHNRSSFPVNQSEFEWKFLGLVGFSDPPKKNITNVIDSFYHAGIDVKMITGDYPVTAISIAQQVKLKHADRVVTGEEIMRMNDEELSQTVAATNVFARMLPEAKLRVVNALKAKGEIVAMTGDGVNDGPALKASHIGVAMGNRGTEIARQAASLVLVDDDLSSMVMAIALGRKIYNNLKKAIQYIISIHIPLISIVTFPLLLGWKYPNIFSPIHVIFFELVMGPTCSIVYENEPMENGIMQQRPRKVTGSFFSWRELSLSIMQGIVIGAGLMGILYYSISSAQTEGEARAMVFVTLIAANIWLTLTGRSKDFSVLTTIRYRNYMVPVVIGLTLLMLVLSLTVQPLRTIFEFDVIPVRQVLLCSAVAAVAVLWIEVYKGMKNRRVNV